MKASMKGLIFVIVCFFTISIDFCNTEICIPRKFNYNSVVCVCNETYCDTITRPPKLSEDEYIIYTSTQDGQRFQMDSGYFDNISSNESIYNTITTDLNKVYQTIIGWGGSFTDSTGINILSLKPSVKNFLMRSYFAEEGIEYSMARVPIGGTDFSTHGYSYDDGEADPELKNFNLTQQDYLYKIPLIKEAISLSNNTLELFASAWTAPIWMKHNGKYTGPDFLRKNMYQPWANYFIKFLRAYKENGLNFWGITTGNEPFTGLIPVKVNSVGWLPNQMSAFIANNLGPALRGSEFSALKLIAIDDQSFNYPIYINKMFAANKDAEKYVDGFGLHWYLTRWLDNYNSLSLTHDQYPSKFILATEACAGSGPFAIHVTLGDWRRAESYALNIIKDLQNWVTGWVDWNMALNLQGGPTYISNFVDSPIIVASASEFYKQPMFYAMGHFSKFIPRNSQRIEVTQSLSNLEVIAFRKPDGENVAVLLNKESRETAINWVNKNGKSIRRMIPPKSITTILYY